MNRCVGATVRLTAVAEGYLEDMSQIIKMTVATFWKTGLQIDLFNIDRIELLYTFCLARWSEMELREAFQFRSVAATQQQPPQPTGRPVMLTAHPSDDWQLITGLDASANTLTLAIASWNLNDLHRRCDNGCSSFPARVAVLCHFWLPCILQLLKNLNVNVRGILLLAWFVQWEKDSKIIGIQQSTKV